MSRGHEFGAEVSMTKQWSIAGSTAPSINALLGGGSLGKDTILPVGTCVESRSRMSFVPRVTTVPSIVGDDGFKLK